ncbi:MAG: cation diffusion facilitator family transporter [Myxococcales bacterium]|nr:cation diffusion facilitator family transporter [Myxococcales bacterium]
MGHHHGHGHHHHHGHTHGADSRRALLVALVLNAAFLLVEVGAWWVTGSLALLSDAAHMLSDVGALALALGAAQLARQRPSASMTFGLARAEVLGAFLNALALVGISVGIVWEAVVRLSGHPPHVPEGPVLVVGLVGLAINLGSVFALMGSDRTNLNVRGALWHLLADALGSVGVVVAALFLMAGVGEADAVVSLAVAALVAVSGVRLLRDAGRVLMQLPPPHVDVAVLRDVLCAVPGVRGLHDLHVWSLDGHEPIVSAHLVVDADHEALVVQRDALRLLGEHGVEHATLQLERGQGCAAADCGVMSRVA